MGGMFFAWWIVRIWMKTNISQTYVEWVSYEIEIWPYKAYNEDKQSYLFL